MVFGLGTGKSAILTSTLLPSKHKGTAADYRGLPLVTNGRRLACHSDNLLFDLRREHREMRVW